MTGRRCSRCQGLIPQVVGNSDEVTWGSDHMCSCLAAEGLDDGYTIETVEDVPVGHWHSYRNESGFICMSYRRPVETVEDVYEVFSNKPDARITCAYCGKRSQAGIDVEKAARWFVSHACAGDITHVEDQGRSPQGDARDTEVAIPAPSLPGRA